MLHTPVLKEEVLKYLNPQPNQNFIDCTLGFGGHAAALLEKIKPNGKVLGIEWDEEKCKIQSAKFKVEERLKVVNDSYVNLKNIVEREKFGPINGILLDLGLSSWEIESSAGPARIATRASEFGVDSALPNDSLAKRCGRGFSFQKNEGLDMRFSENQTLAAKEIINKWSEQDLAEIFQEYGQERFAKNIARNIVDVRCRQPIETTFQLVEIIRKSFPRSYKFPKAHFATRVFQALRIAVNGELDNLKAVLPQCFDILEKDGRIAVIAFHSLEDSIIKNFFKDKAKNNTLQILTKKPIMASVREIKQNSRARSAKLRVGIKL